MSNDRFDEQLPSLSMHGGLCSQNSDRTPYDLAFHADQLQRAGQSEGAVTAFRRAIDLCDSTPIDERFRIDLLVSMGRLLTEDAQFDEARECLLTAAQITDRIEEVGMRRYRTYDALSVLYEATGDQKESTRCRDRAEEASSAAAAAVIEKWRPKQHESPSKVKGPADSEEPIEETMTADQSGQCDSTRQISDEPQNGIILSDPMSNSTAVYSRSFVELPALIPKDAIPESKLVPLDEFIFRRWLEDDFSEWVEKTRSASVYWLFNDFGFGKSAFAAHIVQAFGEEKQKLAGRVVACYFCDSNSTSVDALRSVYQQLKSSTSIEVNEDHLKRVAEINGISSPSDLENSNNFAVFGNALIGKLIDTHGNECQGLVVIDGLDEALCFEGGRWHHRLTDFMQLLDRCLHLRLVGTSRPDRTGVLTRLFGVSEIQLSKNPTAEDGEADFNAFVSSKLPNLTENDRHKLREKSKGSFLYLTLFARNPAAKIPDGLSELYRSQMIGYFSSEQDRKRFSTEVLPWIQLIAANEHCDQRLSFADMDACLADKWPDLGPEFIRSKADKSLNGYVKLNHKQGKCPEVFHTDILDWFLQRGDYKHTEHPFFVDVDAGHRLLAEWAWKVSLRSRTVQSMNDVAGLPATTEPTDQAR